MTAGHPSRAAAAALPSHRYTGVAMALHWLIALAVLLLLASGLVMTRIPSGPATFSLYQAHKALGLTVLALTLLRVLWRLTHRPPPLPDSMPPLERLGAHLGHFGFYVLLLLLPLTGWAAVSYSALNLPTSWFGLFLVPHLPGPADPEIRTRAAEGLGGLHGIGGWAMLALLLVHVAAALRHALILRDGVTERMLPTRGPSRRQGLVLAGLLLAATAGILTVRGTTPGTPTAGSASQAGHSVPPPTGAGQGNWIIDPAGSSLRFTGSQMGQSFEGAFGRFQAEISFNPAAPEQGHAVVTVDTASARTGDDQRDGAMPETDWFNIAAFPQARFEADQFRRTGDDAFEAVGTLTLRGVSRPLVLPFTLRPEGGKMRAEGAVTLVRTDFGVGQGQWSSGDWVGLEVAVRVSVLATPGQ
ncbi:YceI family protein [Oleisolibacter albus]|uniref:YceI family protein n=1 Tax=Oleisolibacter albus TaxID=2171757 RepID=UPI000DF4898E|nr:YceI family protein [Oleisolibacter albus]